MNVYRTINRRKDNSRAHGRSISQNLRGGLNPDGPGIAATLAAVLHRHGVVDAENDLFPFVSLEGDAEIFQSAELRLAAGLRAVALDGRNLSNPYRQRSNPYLNSTNNDRLEDLANGVGAHHTNVRPAYADYRRTAEFFQKRRSVSDFVDNIRTLPLPGGVNYPANNPLADRLRSAMTIAINNPTTRFISVGNGGVGGEGGGGGGGLGDGGLGGGGGEGGGTPYLYVVSRTARRAWSSPRSYMIHADS